mmetsp:Transcript_30498/g.47396  ORF Transcript_30498/g.47396 Transcript_30498/m.47396 type:complete len:272 (-) Transcript_30498:322-1137(-)
MPSSLSPYSTGGQLEKDVVENMKLREKNSKTSFHIFSHPLLNLHKFFFSFSNRNRQRLHKAPPIRIDPICQKIWLFSTPSIDHISFIRSRNAPRKQLSNKRRRMKNIDVIVGPRHSKVGMPKPGIIRANCFKNNGWAWIFASVLSLPGCWAVVPAPVHAVERSKHSRKTPLLVLPCETVDILLCWAPKILLLILLNNSVTEVLDTKPKCRLGKVKVLPNNLFIRPTSCEEFQGCQNFLLRVQSPVTQRILLPHEVRIISHHIFEDSIEKTL